MSFSVNVASYGAVANDPSRGADNSAAFASAMAALASPAGGIILVPPGTFYLSATLQWSDKPIVIQGAGTGVQPGTGSRLAFPAGVNGIIMRNGAGGLGAFSGLRDLHVTGSDTVAGTNDGVRIQATHGWLDNVHVEGFGRYGVYVLSATTSGPGNGEINANTWSARNVRCSLNHVAGWATEGIDSNAGIAVGIDLDSNGGYGLFENSNLGNTYVGMHLSGNGTGGMQIGANSKDNRMVGVYYESDGKTPLVIAAGGGGRNHVDFLLNEATPPYLDNTSEKDSWVVSTSGGMNTGRFQVGRNTAEHLIFTRDVLAANQGAAIRLQNAPATANWSLQALADKRLRVESAQGAAVALGNALSVEGDLSLVLPGKGLRVREGTNAKMGVTVLAGGTATVATAAVAANSRIFLAIQAPGGAVGAPYVSTRTAGTSFQISSTSATDTSTVAWLIVDPAA